MTDKLYLSNSHPCIMLPSAIEACMAIKSTIFKAELRIADMDRHYYQDHILTLARHPSENDERMMLRLLAFALNASDAMSFTKGLSTEDEPELWQKSMSDEIEVWIDLGQPNEKRIRKACGRAKKVFIYTYNYRSAMPWWEQIRNRLTRFDNLSVIAIPDEALQAMGSMARRTMQLQYTIQDGEVLLSNGAESVTIEPEEFSAV
ncbi:MAG: YaeQ family protein [Mariprofundaceae bacterium]|nr:YaeQ family protein [Mariprofundaceae bacterium]